MESRKRATKAGLASAIIVTMMGVGAVAGIGVSTHGSIASLLAGSGASTQAVTASKAAAITSGTAVAQSGTTASTSTTAAVGSAAYVVQQVNSAVVTVVNTMQASASSNSGYGGFGGQGQTQTQTEEAYGSGVIISSDGYIVTNQHVVVSEQSLKVIFADGTETSATVVGEDAYTDIAVIKVSGSVPAVAKFDNSDNLEVGQPVVAIGTALGSFENTVTEGIVSGLHRQLDDSSTSDQDMIQTDASINHGNSGGPLLDLAGNIVGINTAVVRSDGTSTDGAEGLGFAIPSNTVQTIAQELIADGSVSHPYLGISFQSITAALAAAYNLPATQGVYVTDVASNGPASQAGIERDGVITSIDGTTIGSDSNSTLATLLSQYTAGDSVKLTYIAPGSSTSTTVTVTLGTYPSGQ